MTEEEINSETILSVLLALCIMLSLFVTNVAAEEHIHEHDDESEHEHDHYIQVVGEHDHEYDHEQFIQASEVQTQTTENDYPPHILELFATPASSWEALSVFEYNLMEMGFTEDESLLIISSGFSQSVVDRLLEKYNYFGLNPEVFYSGQDVVSLMSVSEPFGSDYIKLKEIDATRLTVAIYKGLFRWNTDDRERHSYNRWGGTGYEYGGHDRVHQGLDMNVHKGTFALDFYSTALAGKILKKGAK